MRGDGGAQRAPLPEGSVIGILGGGQLGRMTALAAASLGYRSHIFAPMGDAPACDVAAFSTRANYDDEAALAAFGEAIDTVTSEFENVPSVVMEVLSRYCLVSPGVEALEVSQHRIREKTLARALGIKTPHFVGVGSADEMMGAMQDMKGGAILKTCRFGYDGKGQVLVDSGDTGAFELLGSDDCILEEKVDFNAEVSFLVARDEQGEVASFPASLNRHEDGILAVSEAPADTDILSEGDLQAGQEAAMALAEKLDLVGVLAVEMFITSDGLVFNEMAPRPHNSFHWTIEGAETSQFSQLVRAITGLPLGSTAARGRWRMENILGQNIERFGSALSEAGVYVHRYGKAEAGRGRKMGHLTRKL